jgi:hypothetical protein
MNTLSELRYKEKILLQAQMDLTRKRAAAKKDPIGGVEAFLVADYALDVANKSLEEVEDQIKKLGS